MEAMRLWHTTAMFRAHLHFIAAFLSFAALANAQSVQSFFKDTWEERLREEPEFASRLGRHEYDGIWTDYSKAARDERRDASGEPPRPGFPHRHQQADAAGKTQCPAAGLRLACEARRLGRDKPAAAGWPTVRAAHVRLPGVRWSARAHRARLRESVAEAAGHPETDRPAAGHTRRSNRETHDAAEGGGGPRDAAGGGADPADTGRFGAAGGIPSFSRRTSPPASSNG